MSRVDPQTSRVDPQTSRVDPQTSRVDPQMSRVDPQMSRVGQRFQGTERAIPSSIICWKWSPMVSAASR